MGVANSSITKTVFTTAGAAYANGLVTGNTTNGSFVGGSVNYNSAFTAKQNADFSESKKPFNLDPSVFPSYFTYSTQSNNLDLVEYSQGNTDLTIDVISSLTAAEALTRNYFLLTEFGFAKILSNDNGIISLEGNIPIDVSSIFFQDGYTYVSANDLNKSISYINMSNTGHTSSVGRGLSVASEPNRSVPKTTKIRNYRREKAIRDGYWNEFTGAFSTAPTNGDDTSALGVANEVSNKFTFYNGGTVTTDTY